MRAIIIALAIVYLAYLAVAWFAQRALMFPGRFMDLTNLGGPPPGIESVWVHIDGGGRVEGWFAAPPSASSANPAPLVVFLHGNAETIDDNIDTFDMYRHIGAAVLMPEYRGYNRSDGTPSEQAIIADTIAMLNQVAARGDVDVSRTIIHGRSIGAGIGASLARELGGSARRAGADGGPARGAGSVGGSAPRMTITVKGLILESAFTSMQAMVARYGIPPFACRDPMNTIAFLRTFDGPVLIMHGAADEIIPVSHGRKLRDAARDATYREGSAGHNDLPLPWSEYREMVRELLVRAGLSGP